MKFTAHKSKEKWQCINWSKPQLLVAENGQYVLSNGKHDYECFEGTSLNTVADDKTAEFSTEWGKRNYTVCDHPVTLEND